MGRGKKWMDERKGEKGRKWEMVEEGEAKSVVVGRGKWKEMDEAV